MDSKDIIKHLKSRIGYGFSQADLAKELKITEATLSRILSGKKKLDQPIISKLGFEIEYKRKK